MRFGYLERRKSFTQNPFAVGVGGEGDGTKFQLKILKETDSKIISEKETI